MSDDWRAYLDLDDAALLAQCEFDRFRASGPGGQKRNKTDSAVRLRHRPSGLHGEANEARSQHENRARALRRLRLSLAVTLRAPVDLAAYAPPPVLAEALVQGRFALAARNARFPAAVAALFDVLAACDWRLAEAAPHLGLTTTALGRALERELPVFRAANERRQALGLPVLHAQR